MNGRRCLSGVLIVIFGLSLFSGVAVAEPFVELDPADLDGEGTTTNPYEITNASELQAMGGNLTANYTLGGTIEAGNTSAWNGGAGFEPIGNDTHPFTGTFSGNGETIQELYINRTTDDPVGLFGATDGAEIKQVGLTDVDISGTASGGGAVFVGGLVGNMSGTVTNTSVSGIVNGSNTVGGLVGNLNGTVSNSYANSSVDGGSQIGGLVGTNANDGNILTAYAIGAVNESGLASEAGGLVGDGTGTVDNSYWDTESTGQTTSAGGDGLTTERMTGNNATVDMDEFAFYDHWIPTESYPVLAWQFFADSAGDGSELEPYRVNDAYGLQAIDADLAANYTLSGTIDMSETADWNDRAGFEPIANGSSFSGSIDGDGHTIRDLTINRSSDFEVGLFSVTTDTSTISNLSIVGASVSGSTDTGILVGYNRGNISSVVIIDGQAEGVNYIGGVVGTNVGDVVSSHSSGSIYGVDDSQSWGQIGGLVGHNNQGSIRESTTNVSVHSSNTFSVGGFVGLNQGDISNSSSNGNISVSDGDRIGGFIGTNNGGIWDSNSNGTISVSGGTSVGGLIGESSEEVTNSSANVIVNASDGNQIGGLVGLNNGGLISESYAAGNIEGENEVGGLIGQNRGGDVSSSYAIGEVIGQSELGGLVGLNIADTFGDSAGTVTGSYALGNVSGDSDNIGGLVGQNGGSDFLDRGNIAQSYATGTVSGNDYIGGLVGNNSEEGTEITSSYAVGVVTGNENRVGGLLGENVGDAIVETSYWDVDTTNQSESDGGEGFTTAEMTGSASLDNLDFAFNPTWIATDDYPRLVWQVDDYTLSVSDTDINDDETADSTVTLSLTDGTTQTATEPAEYNSSEPSIATVADGGQITGVDAGSTQITAEASGFDDSLSLSVSLAPTTSSSSSSSTSSSSSSNDDPEDEPEAEDEADLDDSAPPSTGTEGSGEPPTEEDDETEVVQAAPFLTPMRVLGGGAAAVGSYVAVVLLSRTELFATAAPSAITKAVASVPGAAGMLLAEPEQAAFVVGSVALAAAKDAKDDKDGKNDETDGSEADVAPGELLAIEATIENKGDVPGARVVSLSLDEREDDTPLDLDAHTAESVLLEYQTTPADAGKTLGFTISCETDSADIDITVGDQPIEDNTMSETTPTADDDRTADDQPDETAAEAAVDADDHISEPGDPDETDDSEADDTDAEDGIDAEVDEEELDAGTRTGVADRLWMQKGKILSYTAGLIIIYIGLTNFANNRLAGGLGIFLGVMALPIVRAQLPTATRVWISRYGKVLVVIIAALFSGVLIEPTVVFEAIEGLFGR